MACLKVNLAITDVYDLQFIFLKLNVFGYMTFLCLYYPTPCKMFDCFSQEIKVYLSFLVLKKISWLVIRCVKLLLHA